MQMSPSEKLVPDILSMLDKELEKLVEIRRLVVSVADGPALPSKRASAVPQPKKRVISEETRRKMSEGHKRRRTFENIPPAWVRSLKRPNPVRMKELLAEVDSLGIDHSDLPKVTELWEQKYKK